MKSTEFDQILKDLGIKNTEAAQEISQLGGKKPDPNHISAMRRGNKPVTSVAQMYARMSVMLKEAQERPITREEVVRYLEENLYG